MKKSGNIHKCAATLMLTIGMLLLVACSSGGPKVTFGNGHYYTGNNATEVTEEDESINIKELFLITSINSAEETMRLYRYDNDLEYQYHYGLDTEFLDKYGSHISVTRFTVGKVVSIGDVNNSGKLSSVQISDRVWEYDNITRFSVDKESDVMKIADTKYSLKDNPYIFSNEEECSIDALTSDDTLSVIGMERKILSVTVTTGHGTLELTNTDLFNESYLQLDKKVFAEITPDMQMELPEGTYTLAVANDGWGGSTEITITRGETTQVDLDTIKGEGPKYGSILFTVDVVGAKIEIDGKEVDYLEPISLKYGNHLLKVTADGYDDWSRVLCVNSEGATVMITLDATSDTDTGTDTGTSDNAGNSTGNSSGSGNNSGTTGSESSETESSDSTKTENDQLTDYISTLTDLISSLT